MKQISLDVTGHNITSETMDSEFKVVSSLLKRQSRKGSYEEGEGPQRGYAVVALIDLLEPFADVEPDPCAWGGAELGLAADD